MRIIAGEHRGRSILGPADAETTRPITDRVKENLFNRLHTLGVLGYGRVLDVFSGTGSMGLEALSRGAEHCTFVDRDREAVGRLQQNLDTLGVPASRYRTLQAGALSPVWPLPLDDGSITLALIDPPYAMTDEPGPLLGLLDVLCPKFEPGGVAVLRTPAGVAFDERPGYDGPATVTYGRMALHFFQTPFEDDGDAPPPGDAAPGSTL